MSQNNKASLYPLLSVVIIIFALLSLVFLQMEVRRMGYVMLKHTREYKRLQDNHRLKVMRLAKVTRPQRLREMAISKLTMNEIKAGQIIHISGDNIAVRQ